MQAPESRTEAFQRSLLHASTMLLVLALGAGCYNENELQSCITPIDVGITQPNDATEYLQGDPLNLDANIRSYCGFEYLDNAMYVLSSSIDGELGGQWSVEQGNYTFTTDQVLSVGSHTLTLTAASENSASGEDSVDIVVLENLPPTITISSPAPGNNDFNSSAGVTVLATVTDPAEALDSLSLSWTLDGLLLEEAPANADAEGNIAFVLSSAAVGCHELRGTVTDSLDQQNSDSAEFVLWTEAADLSTFLWWIDEDGDSYGTSTGMVTSCSSPGADWMNPGSEDCDDTNAEVHPGHADYCSDGIDSDCASITPMGCFPMGNSAAELSDASISGAFDLVAGVGDIDGDGWSDLALGGDGSNLQIINGPAQGVLSTDITLTTSNPVDYPLGSLGLTIDGHQDFNGDGIADLLLGNPEWGAHAFHHCSDLAGVAQLHLSSSTLASTSLATSAGVPLANATADSTVTMVGPVPLGSNCGWSTYLGTAVTWLPDADGDGIPDFAISAAREESSTAGAVYIFLSSDAASISSGPVADSGYRLRLNGPASDSRLGSALGSADVDGDGRSDLLISSVSSDPNDAGTVYVVFGRDIPTAQAEMPVTSLAGLTFTGASAGAHAGTSVEGVGDLDGDGDEEFIITAPGERGGDGAVYLVPGFYEVNATYSLEEPFSAITSPNATGAVVFVGASGDGLKTAVLAGDINGDSYPELLIGAPGNSLGASAAGAAYLLYGGSDFWGNWWDSTTGAPHPEVNLDDAANAGASTARFYSSTENENFGYSLDRLDDINGDGFGDIVVGASPSGGTVRLFFGGGT